MSTDKSKGIISLIFCDFSQWSLKFLKYLDTGKSHILGFFSSYWSSIHGAVMVSCSNCCLEEKNRVCHTSSQRVVIVRLLVFAPICSDLELYLNKYCFNYWWVYNLRSATSSCRISVSSVVAFKFFRMRFNLIPYSPRPLSEELCTDWICRIKIRFEFMHFGSFFSILFQASDTLFH